MLGPDKFPKICRCCNQTYDQAAWLSLAAVGDMLDEYERLEMRNCPCGSTLAMVTARFKPDEEPTPGSCMDCGADTDPGERICRPCGAYWSNVDRQTDDDRAREDAR